MRKTEEEIGQMKRKYPNVPAYALPTVKNKSKNPTNELQREISDYVKSIGGYCFRVNTTGTYSEKLGKYIKSGATVGVSDLIACYEGKMICIEVKRGADRQRPEQVNFQRLIEHAKGCYIVVSSFESFKLQFTDIINR